MYTAEQSLFRPSAFLLKFIQFQVLLDGGEVSPSEQLKANKKEPPRKLKISTILRFESHSISGSPQQAPFQ